MGYYAFDLDGTLAHDEGAYDRVGRPIERMVQKAKDLLAEGMEVRIVTARLAPEWGQEEFQTAIIQAWCEEHLGRRLTVQAHKTGGMIVLYDDRAVGVIHNTGIERHNHYREVDVALASQRIRQVFKEKTSIEIEESLALALADAAFERMPTP